MSRVEFSKATKLAAFRRARGRCEGCGGLLVPGKFAYDHRNPNEFSGDNSLENCQCLCVGCHGGKTATKDIPAIAKSNRVAFRAAGIRPGSHHQGVAQIRREPGIQVEGTMTDIVERLRALQQLAESDQPFGYVKDIFRCAADEIERLRNVREQLRAVQALVEELRAKLREAGILR